MHVRVNVPGEGPRASGKVVRWSRVQAGELAVEIQGGHRLVTFQVDTQVLTGADDVADRIADFAQALFAAIDGRARIGSSVRKAGPRAPAAKVRARRPQAGLDESEPRQGRLDAEVGRRRPRPHRLRPRRAGRRGARSRVSRLRRDRGPDRRLRTGAPRRHEPAGAVRGSAVATARPLARPARTSLPGPAIHPIRRTIRYWASRVVVAVLVRAYLRVRLEDADRLPSGPAIYCFNHLSWADPFVLMAVLPFRPRLWFFGPKEEDMRVGGRNRVMHWTGTAIPYKPGKNDLLEATRRVAAVIDTGSVVAIAGEGRIHVRESELLPLSEGAAYFALRSRVPLVPVAIHGTSRAQVRRPGPDPGGGADRGRRATDPRGRVGLTARPGRRSMSSSPTHRTSPSRAGSGAG